MPNNDELINELFDKILDEAAAQAAEDLGAAEQLPPKAELSPEHERRMENMLRRYEKREKQRRFRQCALHAACILLMACGLGAAGALSVGAGRARILNFLFDSEKPNMEIHYTQGKSDYINDRVVLAYIPENFAMSDDYTSNMSVDIEFKEIDGGEGYFFVSISSVDASVHIDTEDAVIEKLKVNGCDGLFSSKPGLNILLWGDDNYIYTIGGNIDKNEMLKIAKNIIM